MLIATVVLSIIIFIFVMPIRIFSNSFASLDKKFLLQNFKFGGIEKNFGIKITEEGVEYINIQNPNDVEKSNKDIFKKIDVASILDKIKINKISIKGCFGDKNNAFSTAIICSSLNIIVPGAIKLIDIKCKKFDMDIHPIYEKNILELQFKINIKINILLILLTFFKILFKRRNKK